MHVLVAEDKSIVANILGTTSEKVANYKTNSEIFMIA